MGARIVTSPADVLTAVSESGRQVADVTRDRAHDVAHSARGGATSSPVPQPGVPMTWRLPP